MSIKKVILIFILCQLALLNYAQEKVDTVSRKKDCQQKEIWEILFKKKVPKPVDTTRKTNIFLLPYVAYNPTKGFQIGAGGSITWYVGKLRATKQSAASFGAEFTSNNQKLFQFKSNVYSNNNRWFLQGDWRYYIYSLPTYGVGTGYGNPVPPFPEMTAGYDSSAVWDDSYHVEYQWFRFHEVFSYRLAADLYAGIGFHFDKHQEIKDNTLSLDSASLYYTPHYAYSELHGFNPSEYIASGLSLNFAFDTRDNMINPYKGYYVNVNYRMNQTWLGSTEPGSQLWAEFRTYIGLEKKLPRHLVAFWLYGGFKVSGQIPYFDLWATGFDQMNSSGRGFLQGRWRGENLMYGEVEYRFPISRCSQVLGGVLFVNATTASSKDQSVPLFEYIRPACGAGLRIMASKANRTNIVIDVTYGGHSTGIYFSAQEAF
ncbi:MAG: BamA/TamA family outer membrane protein [Bacteroidetes bacterium]|nr:BamA/TamA family outer membrane protein [Bacteroidota bacterium]